MTEESQSGDERKDEEECDDPPQTISSDLPAPKKRGRKKKSERPQPTEAPRRSSRLEGTAAPYYGSTFGPNKALVEGACQADSETNLLTDRDYGDDLLDFVGCLVAEQAANPQDTTKTYTQAMRGPDSSDWTKSMNREIEAHQKN